MHNQCMPIERAGAAMYYTRLPSFVLIAQVVFLFEHRDTETHTVTDAIMPLIPHSRIVYCR